MGALPQIGKILIFSGVILVIVGLALVFGFRIPGFGRFPGDIIVEKDGFSFYFPVVTCLAISLLLTLIFALVRMIK